MSPARTLLVAGAALGIVLASSPRGARSAPRLEVTATNATGYIGRGQLVVQTVLGGGDAKLTLGGTIALEERASQLRLDVLSLGIPGADPLLSSLLTTQVFPSGGFTIVYDRAAANYTVWSSAKRSYFTSPAKAASPAPQGTDPRAAVLGAGGDLFGAFSPARSLKDATAFNLSLALAGHGMVNGHPATGLDYQYSRTTKAGDALDVHGRLQLADDLDAVPVQITASVKSKSIPESSLQLDLTTLAKQTPPDFDFMVPAGYARMADLGDVIGKALPQ